MSHAPHDPLVASLVHLLLLPRLLLQLLLLLLLPAAASCRLLGLPLGSVLCSITNASLLVLQDACWHVPLLL